MIKNISLLLFALATSNLAALAGNGITYTNPAENPKYGATNIESQDIKTAVAKAVPALENIGIFSASPQVIMVAPMVNKSRSLIDTSLYTSMLRDTLVQQNLRNIIFVERETFGVNEREEVLIASGKFAGSTGRKPLAYDYLLTGEIQGINTVTTKGMADYFRVTFKLVDRKSDRLVWVDSYEFRKEGKNTKNQMMSTVLSMF